MHKCFEGKLLLHMFACDDHAGDMDLLVSKLHWMPCN